MRSDSASHCWISGRCCQNPLPGWVRSGSRGGQGDAGHCRQRRLKTSLSAPIGRRREEPQVPLPAFTRHPARERPRRGDHISLSAFCSTNKDDDLSSVPGPRHGHPGLSPSHWSALTSAAAVVITRVKGRFYYLHGRANALIQRHGIVPSGWRREEGICPQPAGRDSRLTSLPALVAQASKEGLSLAGESRLAAAARGRCCSLLSSASQESAVQGRTTAMGWGWGEQRKLPSPSSSSSSSSPPSSSSSSTSLSASCSPFSSFSLARQNIT